LLLLLGYGLLALARKAAFNPLLDQGGIQQEFPGNAGCGRPHLSDPAYEFTP